MSTTRHDADSYSPSAAFGGLVKKYAASTLAMLLGFERGGGFLRDLGLAHLCIDGANRVSGAIAIYFWRVSLCAGTIRALMNANA